ncbi:MAG: hypothetical protein M3O87_06590 [Candidatus Dormibacteraeota bacterium]|nr:hypothetical protein [Candidatus Dormibacteraeota bacterium]
MVALLIAIIGGALLFNRPAQAVQGEVITQPANSAGDAPFSPSVAKPSATPSAAASPPPSSGNLTSVNGAVPGLYGGTKNDSSCDREKLIDFLKNNPDKAAAWASVEGIAVGDIPDYVHSLTPVVLRYDTRVTNHGYNSGFATPYQAVLQAGTAVLVDRFGVPRARCYCGNPLLPPQPQTSPHYTGDTWPGFSPTTIVVVVPPGTPVTILTLADPNGTAIGIVVGSNTPSDVNPPTGPPPSPAASPGVKVNPLSGTYKLQAGTGKGSNIGAWQAAGIAPDGCAANTPPSSLYSYELLISPGHIEVNFLNAKASGPIADDGSFSVPLVYTPPIGWDTTMKGKVDSVGGVTGSFDELYPPPASWGCSYPFGGGRVK